MTTDSRQEWSDHDAKHALAPNLTTRHLAELKRPIARAVGRILGASHPDFDDTVQLALIASAEALPSFRGECHLHGYVGRIASRIAARARRRRERLPREALTELADQRSASCSNPALAYRARMVWNLLDEIPAEQAEALVLRVVLGYSLSEVSRASGTPTNTVRSRVRMAREAMRRLLAARPALAETWGADAWCDSAIVCSRVP